MSMSPMQLMQRFHKVSPDRKATYQKMQQTYLAGKVPMGLFTDGDIVIKSDAQYLRIASVAGHLDSGHICNWDDNDRAVRLEARNIHFGSRLFGTWRNTAGVYTIDESVAPQALASLIPNETPSDIFSNLPEWCVYMALPKDYDMRCPVNQWVNKDRKNSHGELVYQVLGFWAMHDRVVYKGKNHLCLDIYMHVDHDDDVELKDMIITPTRILLSPDTTVFESFKIGYPDCGETEFNATSIRQALSMLLWLCVEEPDVTNIKGVRMSRDDLKLPRFARNKKTGVFVPPNQETHFEIAKRMGGEVREWNKEIERVQGLPAKRKAPHIRRGHWTGVWIGSGANKTYKVYWQQPLFINAK